MLRVLDYKTGFSSLPKQKGYEDGALLQTALYMRAVDSLGIGPVDRSSHWSSWCTSSPRTPQNFMA